MSDESDRIPLVAKAGVVSEFDFIRLERKVDRMAEALNTLIRVEERQTNQGKRIGDLETQVAVNATRIDATSLMLSQWINRGIGAWAVAVIVWGFIKFYVKP